MADIIVFADSTNQTAQFQICLLESAGHRTDLIEINQYPWEADELIRYFQDKPVYQWFNPRAKDIRSGKLNPYKLNVQSALHKIIRKPELINGPLIKIANHYIAGFDVEALESVLKTRFIYDRDSIQLSNNEVEHEFSSSNAS